MCRLRVPCVLPRGPSVFNLHLSRISAKPKTELEPELGLTSTSVDFFFCFLGLLQFRFFVFGLLVLALALTVWIGLGLPAYKLASWGEVCAVPKKLKKIETFFAFCLLFALALAHLKNESVSLCFFVFFIRASSREPRAACGIGWPIN